jgi:hypothetical protein
MAANLVNPFDDDYKGARPVEARKETPVTDRRRLQRLALVILMFLSSPQITSAQVNTDAAIQVQALLNSFGKVNVAVTPTAPLMRVFGGCQLGVGKLRGRSKADLQRTDLR